MFMTASFKILFYFLEDHTSIDCQGLNLDHIVNGQFFLPWTY